MKDLENVGKPKKSPKYAKKGQYVWALVIKCPDGPTCTSVWHSWKAMMKEIESDWNIKVEHSGCEDHPFGEDERKSCEDQFYLKCGEDEYLIDECMIG